MLIADMIAELQEFQAKYGNLEIGVNVNGSIYDFGAYREGVTEGVNIPEMIMIEFNDFPMYDEDGEDEDMDNEDFPFDE